MESSEQKVPEKDIKDVHQELNAVVRDPIAPDSPPAKKIKCDHDASVQQEGSKVNALPSGPISYDKTLCDLIHLVKPHIRQLVEKSNQEMQSRPSKTPVSALQELLVQRDITPKYELVHIEGAVEPPFHFRVTVNDFEATGTGHSKKEAKQAAAKALLEILVENIPKIPKAANENNVTTEDNSKQVVPPKDDKVIENPVGQLQEICMSRHWPPPSYETKEEGGLPHRRMFTISCQVNEHTAIGTGQSKKLAKREAAYKVWQALQDTPSKSTNLGHNDNEDQQIKLTNAVRPACGKEMEESESHLVNVYSISKFVVSIGKGLMGTETSDYAYVRTENKLGVDYFVNNIVLGVWGVQRNLGFPKLSGLEMTFFEKAIPHIRADINVGNTFMNIIDENEHPEMSCMNMSC